MTISSAIWDPWDAAVLALTAAERWAAARQNPSDSTADYSSILILGSLLLVLLLALWWAGRKRGGRKVGPVHDPVLEAAMRRGLDARERQLLLAIVAGSGLRRGLDIFTSSEAFQRGVARLLASYAQGRTARESERLRMQMDSLRRKIGHHDVEAPASEPVSTRSIPVGAMVELLRGTDPDGVVIAAVVVRNDDYEIAVEVPVPVDSTAGEPWCVRYHLHGLACGFDTSAIASEDRRLILNHEGQVRVAQSESMSRVTVHAPAAMACFPFLRDFEGAADALPQLCNEPWLDPVDAVVTEVAGPTLRLQGPVYVEVGERVLVMLRLMPASPVGEDTGDAIRRGHIIGHIGRVREVEAAESDMSITVELMGLSDLEVDELTRIARACGGDDSLPALHVAAGGKQGA